MLSGSSFFPKLAGLPGLLDAQGSVEKLSTRILAATLVADALQYVPLNSTFEAQLNTKVKDGLRRLGQVAFEEGTPLWPSARTPDFFTTVETAWAVLSAKGRNFDVDEGLSKRATDWLSQITTKQIGFEKATSDVRCLALMVWANSVGQGDPGALQSAGAELFENRRDLSDDGRAWLALALHYLNTMPDQKQMLLRELGNPSPNVGLSSLTFIFIWVARWRRTFYGALRTSRALNCR